jgi:hypothetical protein
MLLTSKSTRNERIDSVISFKSKNPINNTDSINRNTLDSSLFHSLVFRVKHVTQKRINNNKWLGKIMACLVSLLFFVNIHFIIFLEIKEDFKMNKEKNFIENYSLNELNTTMNDIDDTPRHLYDRFECSAELGSWYANFMDRTWFWVDVFVYFVIPFLTMCFTFSIIKLKLRSINRNYAAILLDKTYNNYNKAIYLRKIKKNNKIIYLLFGINAYFCLSIVPYFVFSLFKNVFSNLKAKQIFQVKSLVDILFYSNNALNIFFYGFTSREYRRAIKGIFLCGKNKKIKKKNHISLVKSRGENISIFCKKNI